MSDAATNAIGDAYAEILAVYMGSDGEATKSLYKRLEQFGPAGDVATNLFRACKASERAKVYRGGGYRGAAYDKKQWSMENLARALTAHGQELDLPWGWGTDANQAFHNVVLYIDLPTGQVSFHTATRAPGPDYGRSWDGVRNATPGRICQWIATLLARSTSTKEPISG